MTDKPTLFVVTGAPPHSKRKPWANRLRRYLHPGNVQNVWIHGAAFRNWLTRSARGEKHMVPVCMVMHRGSFLQADEEIAQIVGAVSQAAGVAVPMTYKDCAFDAVCVHWDGLTEILEDTKEGDPLVIGSLEFLPLPRACGQFDGMTLSGPFAVTGSTAEHDQVSYALRYDEDRERYIGMKTSGRGTRTLHWEEADIIDMIRLGFIHRSLVVRLCIARLHAGEGDEVTQTKLVNAAVATIKAGRGISVVKNILAGLGVHRISELDTYPKHVRSNLLHLFHAILAGTHTMDRLRILFGIPLDSSLLHLSADDARMPAIRDWRAGLYSLPTTPLPGFVIVSWTEVAPAAKYDEPIFEPYVWDNEHDNTSWKRIVREHPGAHQVIDSIQWDVSWHPTCKMYEVQRAYDKAIIAHISATDLRNMIAVGKLVPFARTTTPYPDLDTFNNVVMGHPKERRLERNSVILKHVKGFDDNKMGTGDVPSNKRKLIMDELKHRLEHYTLWPYVAPEQFGKADSITSFRDSILANMAAATGLTHEELTKPIPAEGDIYADVYARMSKPLEYGVGTHKVGMGYASMREAALGEAGAQAQRDSAAKQAAEAKAAAFPRVVHAGEIVVRGEKKRLIARVSEVTAGVISATMAGTNSWRKDNDNTHLELIRNAQIDRTHFGYEKYGVTLDRDDLSLAQLDQHAFEEAMDLVCYLRARVRAMNKVSGNGAEYGPDEEWVGPMVHEAHGLLEGLARQVLRTNPEANKLSQYVELEEPFTDNGRNRLFEGLKAGKVQTVRVDKEYSGVMDFETASRHAMFSPSAPYRWNLPCKGDFTGGIYGDSFVYPWSYMGHRIEVGPNLNEALLKHGEEMIPRSPDEKLKHFRASYGLKDIKTMKFRTEPMSKDEAAELVARYREAHPDAYRFWTPNEDRTERREGMACTPLEAEYLDTLPKDDGRFTTARHLNWYRHVRGITHAEAVAKNLNRLIRNDEPMDPNSTSKCGETVETSSLLREAAERKKRENAPAGGLTFGSDYGAADTISGFSTDSLLHVLRVNEAAARDFFWAFHQLSKNGGWWNDLETGETLLRNRGEMLCLIHSEISEAMEGERKNRNDDHLPDRKQAEVELADAQIRIADYCSGFGYDVIGAMVEKAAYNAQRADHKPENRKAEGGKQF